MLITITISPMSCRVNFALVTELAEVASCKIVSRQSTFIVLICSTLVYRYLFAKESFQALIFCENFLKYAKIRANK